MNWEDSKVALVAVAHQGQDPNTLIEETSAIVPAIRILARQAGEQLGRPDDGFPTWRERDIARAACLLIELAACAMDPHTSRLDADRAAEAIRLGLTFICDGPRQED